MIKPRLLELLGMILLSVMCFLPSFKTQFALGWIVMVQFAGLLVLIYHSNKRLTKHKRLTNGQCWISFLMLLTMLSEVTIYIATSNFLLLLVVVVMLWPYFIFHYVKNVILVS